MTKEKKNDRNRAQRDRWKRNQYERTISRFCGDSFNLVLDFRGMKTPSSRRSTVNEPIPDFNARYLQAVQDFQQIN
jgi:hypothetical protein